MLLRVLSLNVLAVGVAMLFLASARLRVMQASQMQCHRPLF
jgi:hypothetical protein